MNKHERVWDTFTQKWWCVCEGWTSDSMESFEQHAALAALSERNSKHEQM